MAGVMKVDVEYRGAPTVFPMYTIDLVPGVAFTVTMPQMEDIVRDAVRLMPNLALVVLERERPEALEAMLSLRRKQEATEVVDAEATQE